MPAGEELAGAELEAAGEVTVTATADTVWTTGAATADMKVTERLALCSQLMIFISRIRRIRRRLGGSWRCRW